jgi:hypothetical protein
LVRRFNFAQNFGSLPVHSEDKRQDGALAVRLYPTRPPNPFEPETIDNLGSYVRLSFGNARISMRSRLLEAHQLLNYRPNAMAASEVPDFDAAIQPEITGFIAEEEKLPVTSRQ